MSKELFALIVELSVEFPNVTSFWAGVRSGPTRKPGRPTPMPVEVVPETFEKATKFKGSEWLARMMLIRMA